MTEICSGFVMRRTQAPEIAGFVMGIAASASNSVKPKSGCRFPACAKLCSAVTLVSRFGGRSQVGKDHALGNKLKRNTEST
jgi:hypothetical protein